jgi:iron complex outermembrane receptor protein
MDHSHSSSNRKSSLTLSLAVAVALASAAGHARAAQPAAESGGLEEITVTARQVKESLQEVPVAITSLSTEQLERTFAQDLRDLGAYAPNVITSVVPGFNAAAIAIRGVSTGDIPSTFDPAVSVALDGFFLGHYQASLLDMFDIEQVQILRGPQGTLFGKNTIGGVILVDTKRPGNEFMVEGKLRAGNYGRLDVMGAVDVPIVPGVLAARVAVQQFNSDGWFTNLYNGEDYGGQDLLAGRAKLNWTPSDDVDALLSFEWSRDRSDGPAILNTSRSTPDPNGFYGTDAFGLPGVIPGCCRGDGVPLGDVHDVYWIPIEDHVAGLAQQKDTKGIAEDIFGVYLNANWRVGGGELTGIFGSRSVDSDYYYDAVGFAVPGYAVMRSVYRDTWSAEVRYAQQANEYWNFVVGAYYQDNHLDYENNTALSALFGGPVCLCNDQIITTPNRQRSAALSGNGEQTTTAYALFAEANYNLTDKTRVTAGARFSDEKKDFRLRPIGAAAALATNNSAIIEAQESDSWSDVTYRLGVDHRFREDILGYITYSTGFKSGGYNEQATSIQTAVLSFDPEQADAIEAGLKTELFDRRLRLNTAIFYNKYDDLQLDSVVPVPESQIGQESVITNAGKSTAYGVEVEAVALITDRFEVTGSAGYLDAEYDEYICDLDRNATNGNEDCSVLTMKRVPEFQGAISGTYTMPVGIGDLGLTVGYTYTDEFFNDVFNSQASKHESVGLLNASVNLTARDGNWRVSAYGRNLTDEQYQVSGLGIANIWSYSVHGAPALYGVEAAVRF